MPRPLAPANRARYTRRRFLTACLAFGTVASGTGCNPTFNWREFRSPAGFSVVLPGRPQTISREIKLPDATVQMSMTSTGVGATLFAVGAAALPAGLSTEPSARQRTIAHLRGCAGTQRQRQHHAKLGGRVVGTRERFAQGLGGRSVTGGGARSRRACSAACRPVVHRRRSIFPDRRARRRRRNLLRHARHVLRVVSAHLINPPSADRRFLNCGRLSPGGPARTRPSSPSVRARWRYARPRGLSLSVSERSSA